VLEVEGAPVLGGGQSGRQRESVFQGGWHGKFTCRMVGAYIFDFAEPDVAAILPCRRPP
jgi:hypothetical protein